MNNKVQAKNIVYFPFKITRIEMINSRSKNEEIKIDIFHNSNMMFSLTYNRSKINMWISLFIPSIFDDNQLTQNFVKRVNLQFSELFFPT